MMISGDCFMIDGMELPLFRMYRLYKNIMLYINVNFVKHKVEWGYSTYLIF